MLRPTSSSEMKPQDDLTRLLVQNDPLGPPLDPQALVVALRDTFRSPDYSPPRLPAEALQLLKLSRQPDVGLPEIAKHLERDPLLAAKVLRSAQSPIYSRGGGPTSLQQALVRLGVATLTEIFLAESLKSRIFRAPGYEKPMADIRDHSIAVAHIARMICRQTSLYDEYAFLSGLLHDVGMAACILAMNERRNPRAPLPGFQVVWPAILTAHAEASASLCDLWGLPQEVVLAVRMHHDPGDLRFVHPIAIVIAAADRLACQLGFGVQGDCDRGDWSAQQKALQIGDAAKKNLEAEASALVAKLR
jgi:putative nucleotidyltransferase with HDIG domain